MYLQIINIYIKSMFLLRNFLYMSIFFMFLNKSLNGFGDLIVHFESIKKIPVDVSLKFIFIVLQLK